MVNQLDEETIVYMLSTQYEWLPSCYTTVPRELGMTGLVVHTR